MYRGLSPSLSEGEGEVEWALRGRIWLICIFCILRNKVSETGTYWMGSVYTYFPDLSRAKWEIQPGGELCLG